MTTQPADAANPTPVPQTVAIKVELFRGKWRFRHPCGRTLSAMPTWVQVDEKARLTLKWWCDGCKVYLSGTADIAQMSWDAGKQA